MRKEPQQGIRKLVENEIVSILTDQYNQSVDPDVPVRYYLDFKVDARLFELRQALDRLDSGEFGRCSLCGIPIPARIVEASPTTQLCPSCDKSSVLSRHRGAQERSTRQHSHEHGVGIEAGASNPRPGRS